MLVKTVKHGDSYRIGDAIVTFSDPPSGRRRLKMCIDAPRSVEVVPIKNATTAADVRESIKNLMGAQR